MKEELSREERWAILKHRHQYSKGPIPWDRMAFPPHAFLDKYENVYIPKGIDECTEEELKEIKQMRVKPQDIPAIKKHIRGPIDKIILYKQYRRIQRKRLKRRSNKIRTIMYMESLYKITKIRKYKR